MNSLKLKICGMREHDNLLEVAKLQPDYLGFIFFEKSKRDATSVLNTAWIKELPAPIQKTGVFVNATKEFILDKIERFDLQAIQLHGDESPKFCKSLQREGLQIFKVFSIGSSFDFSRLRPYESVCDFFLFDTKGKERGGNGIVFNWDILQEYKGTKPFILSGGISLENIEALKALQNLNIHAIDVNSRFEIKPGLKDVALLKQLKKELP